MHLQVSLYQWACSLSSSQTTKSNRHQTYCPWLANHTYQPVVFSFFWSPSVVLEVLPKCLMISGFCLVKNRTLRSLLEAFSTWMGLWNYGVHYRVIWLKGFLGNPMCQYLESSSPDLSDAPEKDLFIHLKAIY